jgi:outer membrane protein OmpA-like peptidoglycan-associated protein
MKATLTTGAALALLLAACASAPQPNAALQRAHDAVASAEADPNVPKYAALDLEAARRDLAAADDAALHHNDAAIAQSAYMASQDARLAQLHAAAKADDARVAAGQAERDQIMLAARNREVQNATEAKNAALAQRDEATEQAARLQAEVQQLQAKQTPRGLVLTLGDVLFDTGQAQLKPGADRTMDQLAQFLTEHKDRRVEIDGFTDSVGSDAYNEELSQRRADAVKSALMTRGIDASRISTEGYGKAYPVASNSDPGGRQLNRRVEVVIGGDNGSAIAPRS